MSTAGRHSFPSSHATSVGGRGGRLRRAAAGPRSPFPPLAAAMCVSRLVVGVHYPSDVAARRAARRATARLGRRLVRWVAEHGRHG